MPYGPLIGFQEIVTHSRVRDGCHVSTLFGSGRDNFIGIRAVGFTKLSCCFLSLVDIGCIFVLV